MFTGYPHNTYHGPAKHYRPLLNALSLGEHDSDSVGDTKPLWFTDSPQHYVPTVKSHTPVPSPRRKSSSASIEASEVGQNYFFILLFK